MVKFRLPSVAGFLAALIMVSALLPATVRAGASAQYTIRDLGVFTAQRMNNSDDVVGKLINGHQFAMLYRNGVLTNINPPNGDISAAWSVNNLGDVVGEVFFCNFVGPNCEGRNTRGFIYRNGTFTIMGTLGGDQSRALGINDSRQITGYSEVAPTQPPAAGDSHAFIFSINNGTFQDLGPNIGTSSNQGFAINNNGQVTGYASSNTANRGVFLYTNGTTQFIEQDGISRDLNDAAIVVGGLSGNDDGSGRAFLNKGGTRQDLGTLFPQHTFSSANAINNLGHVVGISSESWFTRQDEHAFIFRNAVMLDLNNLVPTGSGWVLNEATDINDFGQIVGNGKLNGVDHAFMLTPTTPMLMADPSTSKAFALESVSFLGGPFRLTTPHNLGSDNRTRITLVTRNLEIIPNEPVAPPVVEAEDINHNVFVLPIEYIGKVPGADWLTQIVVRLPDTLTTGADLQVSVSFRGNRSNKGAVSVAGAP